MIAHTKGISRTLSFNAYQIECEDEFLQPTFQPNSSAMSPIMKEELLSQLDDAMSLSYTRPLSPENPLGAKQALRTKMTMEEIGGKGFLTSTERASLTLPQSLEQMALPGQGLFTPPAGSCFKNPFDLRKQSGRQSVGSKKSRGKSVSFLD